VIQLRAVALWNRDGERRTIELRPGELNIITGEAKTGKSALLEIVEFCLGRSTVSLPEGALTRAVDWYGLLVAADSESVFIGRPGPTRGKQVFLVRTLRSVVPTWNCLITASLSPTRTPTRSPSISPGSLE
jgi:hypothetical protein